MDSMAKVHTDDPEMKGGEDVTQSAYAVEVKPGWWRQLRARGVEMRGIEPVPVEERTDPRPINLFTFWWTASVNLLPITTGLVGTLFVGLSLEASCLTILFFTIIAAIPPAALGTLGSRTGLRQLVQARYSFGLYFVTIAAVMNLATTTGWTIIATILAGQTLSAVSGGDLSWNVGIVIISIVSLLIAFMGYRVVHIYERYAWIPAVLAIIITVGCGGHLLSQQAATEPATAATVLSYGCTVASFTMTWCTMASDFAVYIPPTVPKIRIFLYTFCGLMLPTVPLMCLGAAIGGAIPSIPSWMEAFDSASTGGVMLEMMQPVGGFGKFIAVLLAFSLLGNIAGTMYSITLQFQILLPILNRVPRFFFSAVSTGIIIGVAIPISHTLEESLENFLGLICYWAAVFIEVVATEHIYFRRCDITSYDHAIWNVASKLPLGLAAVGGVVLPFALIVPCMNETWFVGPIAKTTGDIGFEVGFVLSVLFYVPLRTLEKRLTGR